MPIRQIDFCIRARYGRVTGNKKAPRGVLCCELGDRVSKILADSRDRWPADGDTAHGPNSPQNLGKWRLLVKVAAQRRARSRVVT